jgi:hypothetical protein
MAISPDTFLVPTLDIDLAWHTHQLMAGSYDSDCLKYVGRLVDQYVAMFYPFRTQAEIDIHAYFSDDQVEEDRLANGFDLTSRTWKVQIFN